MINWNFCILFTLTDTFVNGCQFDQNPVYNICILKIIPQMKTWNPTVLCGNYRELAFCVMPQYVIQNAFNIKFYINNSMYLDVHTSKYFLCV